MSRPLGIVLVLAWVTAACAAGASSEPSDPPAATARPTADEPARSPAPPSPGMPASTGSPPAHLPLAEIVLPDASIPGTLGAWVLDGRGSDAPWQPFGSLPVISLGPTEAVTIQLVDGAPVGEAQVTRSAADVAAGSQSAEVPAVAVGTDHASISVGPLPTGRWVLAARLFRADGRGDGTTYWAVIVH